MVTHKLARHDTYVGDNMLRCVTNMNCSLQVLMSRSLSRLSKSHNLLVTETSRSSAKRTSALLVLRQWRTAVVFSLGFISGAKSSMIAMHWRRAGGTEQLKQHSIKRIPLPHHIELGTVSLPASRAAGTSAYIFPHCALTSFSNLSFAFHINRLLHYL